MFRNADYDPIDTCQCPDLEKASANADRYKTMTFLYHRRVFTARRMHRMLARY